ncbi:MAG TPA: FtsX-like permease family protein [Polyangiales bacterium]|nr:FtsX-like permease family protein [Polyangiales bacterium]
MGASATLGLVLQMALRNLLASRWKTLIVGGIIAFGALLVVVGSSLLDGVDRAMRGSITGSVAGHLQVFNAKSKDELEIMGGLGADSQDITELPDFAKVRDVLLQVPNVKAAVPMGINSALVTSGNTVDLALARLRETVSKREAGDHSPELGQLYTAQKAHVQQIVGVLAGDAEHTRVIADERALATEDVEVMRRVSSREFWSTFDADPYEHLEFLENRVAPLSADADMLMLRYFGTDPKVFAESFDRMQIVDGQAIPPGKRGFLFSKYVYEEQVKLKAARGLDKLKLARDNRKQKIAEDPDLQRIVRENTTGVRELLLQLDPVKSEQFREKLQKFLGSSEADLGKLLATFFATTDDNLDQRYKFFYAELAPQLELYRVRVGDELTIKAFTRSGYVQSANVKVYGTFAFKGLEKSPQAGALNMMDLVSFRELYGFMTADREREIKALREASGAREVDREHAEAELFGTREETAEETPQPQAEAQPAAADPLAGLHGRSRAERRSADTSYDPRQLETGVVLNVAVIVKDDRLLPQTMQAIEQAGKQAGLPLKAISWQKAAGIIGQFAVLMRAVLFAAVLIIFVVALVVINNALVMATLERVGQIGTLRAIGAQKRFVLGMLLVEAVVIGAIAGALGALLGAAILAVLGQRGIPAFSDVMTFFFSGPRLYPQVLAPQLGIALVLVLLVSLLSSIYPAWLAMRVSPREAMSAEE